MSALLRVQDLQVAYTVGRKRTTAVRGIDFAVREGEIVALVGESGSGKSTVAHAVLRLLPRGGRITGGTIEFAGQDITFAPEQQLRRLRGARIALIPQDPAAFLNPVKRIADQVSEARLIHRMASHAQAAVDAVKLLRTAGLAEPDTLARQYPHQLSGGMRQRVLIAAALAAEPALIVADEPTSALDVTVQRVILDHLRKLTQELGISVLLITHDLSVAAERADRVLVMRSGTIVESGSAQAILQRPTHSYTQALIASTPGRTHTTSSGTAVRAGKPVLVAERLSKTYSRQGGSRFTAAQDVSFVVHGGETVGLVGESGSGKSTIARILACLDTPTEGRVVIDGIEATALAPRARRQLRQRVQLIHQSPYTALDPKFSAGRSVAEPLRAFGVSHRRARVAELFDQVGLASDLMTRKPSELSGGQRQRVAIARALALRPSLLICDEPVSALDVTVQKQILDLFTRLRDELGLAYVFISHDLAVVRQLCDRLVVMRDGAVVESAPTEELFIGARHPYTKDLIDAVPGGISRHFPAALHPPGSGFRHRNTEMGIGTGVADRE